VNRNGIAEYSYVPPLAACLLLTALNVYCFHIISVSGQGESYHLETRLFILLITLTLPITFFITRRWVYLVVLSARLVFLYIASRTAPVGPVLLLPALTLAYLVEIGLFLTPVPALTISLPLIGFVVVQFHFNTTSIVGPIRSAQAYWGPGMLPVIFVSTALVFITVSLVAVVHFREKHIRALHTLESRDEVITNLMNSNMDLQYFATREGANSAKRERLFITREIHDVVGYSLSNIAMLLNAAAVAEGNDHRIALILKSKQMTEECLQDTRKILRRLRAPEIALTNNLTRIQRLVNTFESATGIVVEIHFGDFPDSLGAEIDSAFYRFIQIGLVNSFTHGKAEKVRIIFSTDADFLYVRVWDNGKGIDQDFQMGIGLTGMQERLGILGGQLALGNCTDGFEIRAKIPKSDHAGEQRITENESMRESRRA
jgi:signal transduction histidine kinase